MGSLDCQIFGQSMTSSPDMLDCHNLLQAHSDQQPRSSFTKIINEFENKFLKARSKVTTRGAKLVQYLQSSSIKRSGIVSKKESHGQIRCRGVHWCISISSFQISKSRRKFMKWPENLINQSWNDLLVHHESLKSCKRHCKAVKAFKAQQVDHEVNAELVIPHKIHFSELFSPKNLKTWQQIAENCATTNNQRDFGPASALISIMHFKNFMLGPTWPQRLKTLVTESSIDGTNN